MNGRDTARAALRFVLIIGVVNLFADMTYEGGRAITGPFLGSLGASATAVVIPAVLCLVTLVTARTFHPSPHELETRVAAPLEAKGFSTAYWLYVAAGALIAMGFADFALIAFHFHRTSMLAPGTVPIFYAVAMAMGALAALIFGRWFDRRPRLALLLAFAASALFAPFVFRGGVALALLGMVLWGIGIGAQDSLLKAALARVVSCGRRSTAFGVFDTGFGIAWFVGSAVMGALYDVSIPAVVVFSVVGQLVALPVLWIASGHATWIARS